MLYRSKAVILIFLLLVAGCFTQLQAQVTPKKLGASRISEKIVIDGKLDEAGWLKADKATGFIQNTPYPGMVSAQETEVSILYDDDAIYIGAIMHDRSPDSILKQMTPRDTYDGSNTDAFGIIFDTYSDYQNGFAFAVTAAGVQADATIKFDGFDYTWNAAWYSKVTINKSEWCAEIKIPYSALRFPKIPEQNWSVNFFRTIRRTREKSFWNPVMPGISNILSESGKVAGIQDIISPLRLALLPYISAYGQTYGGTTSKILDGGMDIKYGINESFTLDMTLVPDFGQTIYDNQVLNLSPVEVRYNDNRYFFTEGVDLFNKDDLFYSRRVGGTPVNYGNVADSLQTNEKISENPVTTRLYNALKVSGRTSGNLGIGFFNAVSAPAYATIIDTITGRARQMQTAPLTNYNVFVLDQALKNNSYISFINTNVTRQENSYNADVTGMLYRFATKENSYATDGSFDVSQIFVQPKEDIGYRYYADIGKIKGNYLWTLRATTISDNFNPNDLGYLARNNISTYSLNEAYNIYKPFWVAVSASNSVNVTYNRVFNPDVFQSLNINGSHNITFNNYLTTGVYWTFQPLNSNDYYEPRTEGRYYIYPKYYQPGCFFSSDYRKKFALDGEVNYQAFSTNGRNGLYWSLTPHYRFNDKFSMIYSFQSQLNKNDVGFVADGVIASDSIYFGTRKVNTITNTLSAAYTFTSTMSLSLNARHYWSQANYSKYSYLNSDGTLAPVPNYAADFDVNFNSFNIYTSLVWQFKPGSELSLVYQNSIYSSGQEILSNYFDDVNATFQNAQTNSLSLKVVYYIDYQMIKRKS